ncbi:TonB-dependent receptor [Sphingobium sp. MK2]|uniref:TonB-dependent receptor n=1 Tax=Sphingobium sp. MK2 TaxID=3116540 RepID=UPI0032E3653C
MTSGTAIAQEAVDDAHANQEIIVTAERRATSLQKSSLAVQVLTPEELQYVNRPQDLTAVAPGVMVGATGVNPQVYIRGVGDTAGNTRDTTSVNFSIDGINLARASGATTAFFDLARVEVLKGPQGTLYGRNASGGAVNVITVRPVLGEVSGYVTGEYGSFDLLSGEAALNLPLGTKAAIRVAGQVVDRDGYMSDGGQDQRTKSLRARILFEPSDRFSLLLNLDGSHIGGNGSGNTVLPVFDNDPWRSNTEAPRPYPINSGPAIPTPTDRNIDADLRNISAELNVGLGDFATLTVLPAYRYTYLDTVAYSATLRFAEITTTKQTSVEARLGNNSDRLKWVLGGYYYREKMDQGLSAAQGPVYSFTQTGQTTVSKAVFGQATFSIIPSIRIIGGLRYSSETVDGVIELGTGAPPIVPINLSGNRINISDLTANRTNWKVGVEADLGEASMAYATASTGFKAGGYSPFTSICGGRTSTEHEPEDLTAYSAGLRNRFLGGALQVNMEAFYWKYKNQQFATQQDLQCNSGIARQRFILNAGESTIQGANIDVVVRPFSDGVLHFFAEYADGNYDNFLLAAQPVSGVAPYLPARGSRCSYAQTGGTVDVDCSGQSLPRLPKWSLALDYQHTFRLKGGGLIRPKVDLQHASSRWADAVFGPNGRLPSYTQLNGQIAYKAPVNSWEITAYVRNITNAKVYTGGLSTTTAAPNGSNIYSVTINPPRAYGIRATKNF